MKMSSSGCLFDPVKLNDVSKNVLSRMSAQQIYDRLVQWTAQYDKKFHDIITRDPAYTLSILSIGRGGPKPRKDFGRWNEVKPYIGFFFKEYFKVTDQPRAASTKRTSGRRLRNTLICTTTRTTRTHGSRK
jgi:glutamyl-tRNA synthetase